MQGLPDSKVSDGESMTDKERYQSQPVLQVMERRRELGGTREVAGGKRHPVVNLKQY